MHRFFLPPEQCLGPSLVLTGAEAHHAQHVLRVRPRECVMVLDGAGNELLCEVSAVTATSLQLTVKQRQFHNRLPAQITLLQALPKGKIMESIVQKATELGAFRIVPLLTERVVGRLDDQDAAQKVAKWQQVARESIKQCGSPWLPIIELPMTPAGYLQRQAHFELPLIASLQSGSKPASDYLRAFQAEQGRLPASAAVWVGPEGDFTEAETETIRAHGFKPITLGPLTLRSETAATYCLSILSYELQLERVPGAPDDRAQHS